MKTAARFHNPEIGGKKERNKINKSQVDCGLGNYSSNVELLLRYQS